MDYKIKAEMEYKTKLEIVKLFCLGGRVYNELKKKGRLEALKEQFGANTQLIELPHYSSSSTIATDPERYHNAIQQALNEIKS